MTSYSLKKPLKLEACARVGPASGAELFIVEGDSASSAVSGVRNADFQAVLPMQGKPLNALRATPSRVAANELYSVLSQALGTRPFDALNAKAGGVSSPWRASPDSTVSADSPLAGLRYQRVLLLFDPDADGIHCGALMLMYFYRWLRPLLDAGRIELVRAPMFELRWMHEGRPCGEPAQAYNEPHQRALSQALIQRGAQELKSYRYRGLGNLDPALLAATCVDPRTRKSSIMTSADALIAIDAFAPSRSTEPPK